MANHFEKHFTLDQANEMIPHVRRLFAEVRALLKPSTSPLSGFPNGHASGHNGKANGNGHSNGNGNGNGNGSPVHESAYSATSAEAPEESQTNYSDWTEEKRHEAAYRLLNALQSQGVVIQDVERGLIDFPSIQNGHEVFLCYELSDGLSIQYFHECDAGYAGRKLITETDQ